MQERVREELLQEFYNALGEDEGTFFWHSFVDEDDIVSDSYTKAGGDESYKEIDEDVAEKDFEESSAEPYNDVNVTHDEKDVQELAEANKCKEPHTDTHRHTQTHRHTDTHTNTHTHTHTHIHTHKTELKNIDDVLDNRIFQQDLKIKWFAKSTKSYL